MQSKATKRVAAPPHTIRASRQTLIPLYYWLPPQCTVLLATVSFRTIKPVSFDCSPSFSFYTTIHDIVDHNHGVRVWIPNYTLPLYSACHLNYPQ